MNALRILHAVSRWRPGYMAAGLAVALYARTPCAETLKIRVYDDAGKRLLPSRVHLSDADGESVFPDGVPRWRDHFVMSGDVTLNVPPGAYRYEIERGPEYRRVDGSIRVTAGQVADFTTRLSRLSHLREEGWWSGDLHVHRDVADVPLLMDAEDLDVAPVITWWNRRNPWQTDAVPGTLLRRTESGRYYHILSGEDERGGGALLFFHMSRPIDITQAEREYPSSVAFLEQVAAIDGSWIDIEKPFWWDVPLWVATGHCDSIGLANNHMCRSSMYESEAWGRPRNAQRLPAPRGNGYWTQEIYYQLLNAGIRLSPSAGSASGVLPNPVGYNRVYVYCGDDFSYENWWQGLKAGRSFVSNGPLLRVRANGHWPGKVFRTASAGASPLTITLDAVVDGNDPIQELEIIRNGEVVRRIPLDEWESNAENRRLSFDASGWFLVRTIVDVPHTFRFASTAPWYVEVGDSPRRISRQACEFFRLWVDERAERLSFDDVNQQRSVMGYLDAARLFWDTQLAKSNAE